VLTELFRVRLELATAFAIAIWIITFVAIMPFRRIGREVSE